jgi:hypothetical protein
MRRLKVNIIVRCSAIVLVAASVLAGLAGRGHAQFTLYDNFITGTIDPSLWQGISGEGTFSAPTAELIRSAADGSLRLKLVSWGNDTSDTGSTGSNQGVQIKQLGTFGASGALIGVKLKVTVLDAAVEDCPANPLTGTNIRARAQFYGWFFNDGSSTGSSDATGNIAAGIQLGKEANGSRPIQPFVLRCLDATCTTSEVPAGVTAPVFTSLTWSTNLPLIFKIRWDRANGKFRFLVRDQTTLDSETAVVDYLGIVTDAGAPSTDLKRIRVANTVKNCSVGSGGRKQVMMDALFDNISVQRLP